MNGRTILAWSTALAAALLGMHRVEAATYTFQTLNYPNPGVYTTMLRGISGGSIVGVSDTAYAPGFETFRESGGVFTTLAVPGAGNFHTQATGIYGDTVVGCYSDSNYYVHGFSENNGTYSTFDVPTDVQYPADGTIPVGISGNTIAGYFRDSAGYHGFTKTDDIYTILKCPLAPNGTIVQGIFGDTIVGSYEDGTGIHGFSETNGIYTTLNVPGAEVWVRGISGNVIVGSFVDSEGITHGFTETDGNFSILDFPGAASTQALGIDGNTIVGYYINSGQVMQGFIATAIPEPASLAFLAVAGVGLLMKRRSQN